MNSTLDAAHRAEAEFDYIVVGSGAGGGPLAARLAEAGFRVLVIEAGSDQTGRNATDPELEVSLVPGLHAASTEDPALSWEFFVEHYTNPPTGEDPKRHRPGEGEDASREGIFYPRAAALGGCTIHNAMITIAGPDSDWDDLADFLGDESWRSERMRTYFQKLEHNDYSPLPRTARARLGRARDSLLWLFGFTPDHTSGRHGFNGWLHTSVADISIGLADKQLVKMLKAALRQAKSAGLERAGTLVHNFLRGSTKQNLDPNHATTQAESPEGLVLVPVAVCGERTTIHQDRAAPFTMRGRRSSPREFLLEVQARHPDRLVIQADTLVTRVLFEDGPRPRAVGVEVLRGKDLYRAHARPSAEPGRPDQVFVKQGGEVILCGGSFNTPQVLMLSGLGDVADLEKAESGQTGRCALKDRNGENLVDDAGQPRRVHLPGVGRNLQDRYEVSLISEMKRDFSLLNGATFREPASPDEADPHLKEWRDAGTGLYSSNGAVLGIFKRSRPDLPQPDLFIFGAPVPFRGYEVGYSNFGATHNLFTWVILKGHTRNNGGTVTLRSLDPLDTPLINFHYFNERTPPADHQDDPDLVAIVDGVKFVRGITDRAGSIVVKERHPGSGRSGVQTDQEIKDWIRREAWGHHACGTCRMGPDGDELAVLDSDFRVRGVDGLRVVDASVFPNIPGYFIVTNLYMVSEKAADVIINQARNVREETPTYPRDMRLREVHALGVRRSHLQSDPMANGVPVPATTDDGLGWADDVTGLGLSGGGIRSATVNLGVLQAMARGGNLRRIDFLSTVSGGGYIGAFLGRFFDRLRAEPYLGAGARPAHPAPSRVEDDLIDPESRSVRWLRKHGNYVSPAGPGDSRYNTATFLRNFLSVHFVVGLLLFGLFGLANAVRYGLLDRGVPVVALFFMNPDSYGIGGLLARWLGPFYSPWFILFELIVLFLVVPRIVGYWIVSPDRHESYLGPALVLLVVLATVFVVVGVHQGLMVGPLLVGLSLFTTFFQVELAWRRGRIREDALGTGGPSTQRLRTRNYLTYELGLAIALAGVALGFAAVDAVGHGLQQVVARNGTYLASFAAFFAAITAATPAIRAIANLVAGEKKSGEPSATSRAIREQAMAGLTAVVLFAVPLVFYSFASHAAYRGGLAFWVGAGATALAVLGTLILAHPAALGFVNRSSLAQQYAARLARAYLGASNPLRHRPEGADVTEVMPGDDVSSIANYRPHEAGGPIHLINMIVNQTVDFTSFRGNRDRKGENLAVSSLGMSIGTDWHAAWDRTPAARERHAGVQLLGYVAGDTHPLADEHGNPPRVVEMLPLRQWMAISGAAVGPGRGQTTRLGTSLLFGMANLRTDYWWDSGLEQWARDGFSKLSLLGRFLYLLPRLFLSQSLLLSDWVARFPGPWDRYWNLADGGFFENLGGYELIRRRVPRIILCDASSDPTSNFEGLAELMRKVRIDFNAHIEPFSPDELDALVQSQHLTADQRSRLGTLDELRPSATRGGVSGKHASLFRVRYVNPPGRGSILLYIKATVTGDESADVREYRASHPDFPHQSTSDQFFDEAQWESYRKLGEHLGEPFFAEPGSWFWTIPLERPSRSPALPPLMQPERVS